MKRSLVIVILLVSSFSYGKQLPSPFWYNLSKKILVETQRLIAIDDQDVPVAKPKVAKAKVVKTPLKCQESKETRLQTTLVPTTKDADHEI